VLVQHLLQQALHFSNTSASALPSVKQKHAMFSCLPMHCSPTACMPSNRSSQHAVLQCIMMHTSMHHDAHHYQCHMLPPVPLSKVGTSTPSPLTPKPSTLDAVNECSTHAAQQHCRLCHANAAPRHC
jgi:hypothetical protein